MAIEKTLPNSCSLSKLGLMLQISFRSSLSAALATFCLLEMMRAADSSDTNLGAPVPANEAPARMTVPDGFRITLFAGEPDLVKPIAMTTDERGRLWVVESLTYPEWTTNRVGS